VNTNRISISVVQLPSGELLAFAGSVSDVTAKAQSAMAKGGQAVMQRAILYPQRIKPATLATDPAEDAAETSEATSRKRKAKE
jgi:hypothetical protein